MVYLKSRTRSRQLLVTATVAAFYRTNETSFDYLDYFTSYPIFFLWTNKRQSHLPRTNLGDR